MAQTQSTTSAQDRPGRITWIERPWNLRYFIHSQPEIDWKFFKEVSTDSNLKRAKRDPGRKFFTWPELFEPENLLKIRVPDSLGNRNFAVVVVSFNEDGLVTTSHSLGKPLIGRINQLQYLGLSDGDGLSDHFYYLADWFTGIGDESTHWAPAFCNGNQTPNAAMIQSDGYLYGPLFKPDGYRPLFGCREWAYQLYDSERPYIDVTSYEPTSPGESPKGYIREFMGWARFGDNKPIIGQHEGNWYCLHDCVGGDKPSLIPDINAWAKRLDWPVPIAPTKVPTFPDPPAKTGTYPHEGKPISGERPSLNSPETSEETSLEDGYGFPDVPPDVGC